MSPHGCYVRHYRKAGVLGEVFGLCYFDGVLVIYSLPAYQLVAPTILPWGNIELGGLKLPPDAVACGWALTIRDPFTPQSTPPHQRREHQK